MEEYNKKNPKHFGQNVVDDPRDGKKWVEDQIEWFVRQVSILIAILSSRQLKKSYSRARVSLPMEF